MGRSIRAEVIWSYEKDAAFFGAESGPENRNFKFRTGAIVVVVPHTSDFLPLDHTVHHTLHLQGLGVWVVNSVVKGVVEGVVEGMVWVGYGVCGWGCGWVVGWVVRVSVSWVCGGERCVWCGGWVRSGGCGDTPTLKPFINSITHTRPSTLYQSPSTTPLPHTPHSTVASWSEREHNPEKELCRIFVAGVCVCEVKETWRRCN